MDTNNKTLLKPEQKQQLKKYAVFVLMFLVFGGSLWLIFKPDGKEKIKAVNGLNTELPLPQEEGLLKDKISAFEQATLFQEKPVRSLEEFSSLIEKEEETKVDLLPSAMAEETISKKYSASKQPSRAIQSSASAYNNINNTLGNFYDNPKANPENEKLKAELKALKQQLAEKQEGNSIDEQLMLMEKSYQMAAKYMPKSNQSNTSPVEVKKVPDTEKKQQKTIAQTVVATSERNTSALHQTISDSAFLKQVSQPRNYSFISPNGQNVTKDRNTIEACVNTTQKLINGQNVQLRLLESVETNGMHFPENSLITGIAQIQGERLRIFINSLEQNGSIIPVQLTAYDTDGQLGLFIPGSVEVNALKEITATMGRDAGTSISINQGTTAAEQLAADVGRSFIQGTSQYVSKKLRTSKVTLKAGHRILLMPAN
ncbi:Bacteroides conjugative transposon TraM protein [Mariniphaga anaerophila]|uniref:Bacteroides conjugative transposon TraM protein n=1 Tax=Mariniphaga anaerophila TaxID=1484053 RepID=A0A1M4U3Q4_9BACT|nr:conjugative transposon protein TraM [Mariniphaga anaerophila]SHE51362.1 Bacteroides conjugative transposon TraM protein [Mariniphaga anaerophila]